MRVLFLAGINKSHLYAMTPLAWALQIAGHQVRVASQPDLADDVAQTGFTPVPVGQVLRISEKLGPAEPAKPGESRPQRWEKPVQGTFPEDPHGHLASISSGFFPLVCPDPLFDDFIEYAQSWKPDLIIWNSLALAGGVAARISGAAHARLLFGADGLGQIRAAFRKVRDEAAPESLNDPLADWLGPKLQRYGHEFDEEIALGQWTIDPMPPWVYHPPADVHYVPIRHVPYNGPSRIPDWMNEPPTRPRVCLTLGVSHRESHGIEASVVDLFDAVADLDIEVIATLNRRQLADDPKIPDNVRAVEFVPLNALLPSCAAIVHHGGTQTFAAAMENAVPQLIVPSAYWTEKWWGPVAEGNGLERRGAGVYVADSDFLTVDMLREELVRVLNNPSYKENAVKIRDERLGTPTANELVPQLERLTARHRGLG
ncbi:activator-dependent family glycosyltransferase [Micromonospora sp. NBC_01699]|uniref:activator-dependent family glycosyltransferase n=1 Tax=Micromonospora sp. NBC_01699 TaxID=2975984 RepID=UPI002E2D1D4D|nr:activator-dependent family glycosyltransferase [Micromonospora sp. NBC_01699]